jgi:hypothetical protein
MKSATGLQEAVRLGGKDGGMKYCAEWKKELDDENRVLQERYKKGDLDIKLYNQARIKLNQMTADLNGCIAAMNKKFS